MLQPGFPAMATTVLVPYSIPSRGVAVPTALKLLMGRLRPYVDRVIAEPGAVEKIVDDMLKDYTTQILLVVASLEALHLPREEFVRVLEDLRRFVNELKSVGIDVEEAVDLLIEHDMWKHRQLIQNRSRYLEVYVKFFTEHPGEAQSYVRTYFAALLLFLAITKTKDLEKLRRLTEIFARYAEELEAYTATFDLMLNPVPEEERRVIGTASSPRELRRVLQHERVQTHD